jgi:hypothetical protein
LDEIIFLRNGSWDISKEIQPFSNDELFISDLLSRLQMWTIAAEIINISNLPALTELNQVSTRLPGSPGCVLLDIYVLIKSFLHLADAKMSISIMQINHPPKNFCLGTCAASNTVHSFSNCGGQHVQLKDAVCSSRENLKCMS